MFTKQQLEFLTLAGDEAAQYSQFLKAWGTRERVNDIVNPKYSQIGDVMLPRNSVIHYQQQHPGEYGPSNQAAFIANYDARINIFFWPDYEAPLGVLKNVVFNMPKEIKRYESGHFNYKRTRNYQTVVGKPGELLVNNMALAQVPIAYNRQTFFTPFQKQYNNLFNLIAAVNQLAVNEIHQFAEFRLPRVFPSYIRLEQAFEKYRKFFDEDGNIIRYDKAAIRDFQAEGTFWFLDLFGILMGYDYAAYSQFNKLSDKARGQLELIFTYEGKCWIANLQTLIDLVAWDDKPGAKEPPASKFKYFKRFYLALVSLISPILEELKEEDEVEHEENKQEVSGKETTGAGEGTTTATKGDKAGTDVAPAGGIDPLSQLYKRDGTSPEGTGVETPETAVVAGSQDPADELSPDTIWSREVDNDIFERATVESASISSGQVKYGPTAAIDRTLDERARKGSLTTKERQYFEGISTSYKQIEFGGVTLEEIMDIKPADLKLANEPLAPDSPILTDKSVLHSKTMMLGKEYREKLLERDIVSALVMGLQTGGMAVLDMDRESVITAESKYDVYTFKVQPVPEGNQSTRRFRIPRVDEDNTFTVGDVKMYGQNVRMEIPIRKINKTKVALTSYYDKKIMVERSPYRANNFGHWLKTNIIQKSYLDKTLTVQLGGFSPNQKEVCWYYSILAERFKLIENPRIRINLDTTQLIGDSKELRKLCTGESWIIDMEHGKPVLIDSSGLVTVDGTERGYVEELLGLPMHRAPVPNTTMNINGFKFQAVVVLAYWIGFGNLLDRLNPTYRSVEPGQRVNLSPDEYMVQFADERLVFNRREELPTLVLSGLVNLPGLRNFSRAQLDDPNVWFSIVSDPKVRPTHFGEMGQMFNQFIDPMTARELRKRKYPVEMDALILRAIEMLLSNETEAEVEITEQRFVGYERFAGHIYREFVKSNRQFRNKPGGMKKTFDLNPESIMMNIITDSSFQSTEEVNPVHQIKQQEEVTFGGSFGRSDRAMVRRTRGQLPNYAGIISEAGKDSGKVGFITYLTSDAKISDLGGNVDVKEKITNAGRLSITGNLLYGTTRDDSKRSLFSGVQLSQWMAADSYAANPIRTSYDTMLAYRTSELYSSISKQDGKVKSTGKQGMVVEYADGTEDKFPLGYEIGKGAGEYHKHTKITDMKVGDSFTKGKVLAWDDCFFSRDPADPNRVNPRLGTITRLALIEDQFTFEDSVGIVKEYADKVRTPFVKQNHFSMEFNEHINMFVKIGDHVEYDQVIAEIQDEGSAMFDNERDPEAVGLDRLGVKQEKAKVSGKITKMEVLYNGDPEDAGESVQKFIKQQDAVRAKAASFKKDTATTGSVGGHTAIGKSKVYQGTLTVNIYIEADLATTVADKFVVGNQMKGTVGFIYPSNIYTPDGRKVDMTFSVKSLLNRMVLSLRDKLVGNETNNVYTGRLINKYGRYD